MTPKGSIRIIMRLSHLLVRANMSANASDNDRKDMAIQRLMMARTNKLNRIEVVAFLLLAPVGQVIIFAPLLLLDDRTAEVQSTRPKSMRSPGWIRPMCVWLEARSQVAVGFAHFCSSTSSFQLLAVFFFFFIPQPLWPIQTCKCHCRTHVYFYQYYYFY